MPSDGTTVTGVQPTTAGEKLIEVKRIFTLARGLLAGTTEGDKSQVPDMIERAKVLQSEALSLKEIDQLATSIQGDETANPGDDITKAQSTNDAKFDTWGEFLQAVWFYQIKGVPDNRLRYIRADDGKVSGDRKALTGATASDGGFLLPTEFDANLRGLLAENSFVRQRATIIPMTKRSIAIPVVDQTGTTASQPHWFGGMTFSWQAESAQKTESSPTFKQIELVANKLIGYTTASDELVDDSAVSLDAFMRGPLGFAGGVAWREEYSFLMGTGAGQPLGVVNAPCTISQVRATANQVNYADLVGMVSKFLPTGRGVWIISQSAMPQILQLSGPSGNASYLWQVNAVDNMPNMLLGYPVIWTEKLPALGTKGDVLLADFTYYLIGDRQSTTIETTKFDRWQYDDTSWRVVHRVDGQPWLQAAITYYDGATTISPFVVLDDPA